METLSIEHEMTEVWKTLSLPQKQSVIQLIHSFKSEEPKWTEQEILAYNKDIEEAEQRISNGQFVTHEDVVKGFKKWQ
jgi:hypothetical protein